MPNLRHTTSVRHGARASLLLALCALAISNCYAAGAPSSTVKFVGNVAALPKATCSYDSLNLNIALTNIAAENIRTVSDAVAVIGNTVYPGTVSAVPAAKAAINAFSGGQGYGSGQITVTCKDLTTAFTLQSKDGLAAANNGAYSGCGKIGCSYLSVNGSNATMNTELGLAIFLFATWTGNTSPYALWMDLNAVNGTSTNTAPRLFTAADTAGTSKQKTLEFGFLLLKKDNTTWVETTNSGLYTYTSAVELSLVYE